MEEKDLSAAIDVFESAAKSGLGMGVVFAGSRGIFPGEAVKETVARVVAGLVGMEFKHMAETGQGFGEVKEGELDDRVFQWGVDVYFLLNAMNPKTRIQMEADIRAGKADAESVIDKYRSIVTQQAQETTGKKPQRTGPSIDTAQRKPPPPPAELARSHTKLKPEQQAPPA